MWKFLGNAWLANTRGTVSIHSEKDEHALIFCVSLFCRVDLKVRAGTFRFLLVLWHLPVQMQGAGSHANTLPLHSTSAFQEKEMLT